MKSVFLGTIAALLSLQASAEIYKCEVGGRQVYQGTPCTAGQQSYDLEFQIPKEGVPQPEPTPEELAQIEAERAAREAERAERRAEWEAEIEEKRRYTEQQKKFKRMVFNHQVAPGMTKEQVRRAWGSPSDINYSDSTDGRYEHWHYSGRRSGSVHFYNGEVFSVDY